ncbi:MAG: carboxylating nicotinate-nucleotide diphosphorylase [Acidimicrobiia bacterium]
MLKESDFQEVVSLALAEDLSDGGDITTQALVDSSLTVSAQIVSREEGVVAGLEVARYVLAQVDPEISFQPLVEDGDRVAPGEPLADLEGRAGSLLTAERTALNFLGRMSGVATATSRFVAAAVGTGAKISDTRKTMPGMRPLDKYAVRMGGGVNHRFGLYDAVMIKDNHIAAVGDIARSVSAAKARVGPGTMIVVEVETLEQLAVILDTRADRVLLDNMDLSTLRRAVEMVGGRFAIEASGGVTLENVREVAETGVDLIAVGWITHSASQLDVALDFHPAHPPALDFHSPHPSALDSDPDSAR